MPVPATIEKMLVFTAYFQLVVTPLEDFPSSSESLCSYTLGGDNLKKKNLSTILGI